MTYKFIVACNRWKSEKCSSLVLLLQTIFTDNVNIDRWHFFFLTLTVVWHSKSIVVCGLAENCSFASMLLCMVLFKLFLAVYSTAVEFDKWLFFTEEKQITRKSARGRLHVSLSIAFFKQKTKHVQIWSAAVMQLNDCNNFYHFYFVGSISVINLKKKQSEEKVRLAHAKIQFSVNNLLNKLMLLTTQTRKFKNISFVDRFLLHLVDFGSIANFPFFSMIHAAKVLDEWPWLCSSFRMKCSRVCADRHS